MKTHSSVFSQAEGITIQASQVEAWKKLLRPELHKYIDEKVAHENSLLRPEQDGWSVFRGNNLAMFVMNELRTSVTSK